MELLPILVAVFWTVLLVWSLMRLPALHPVQIWALPWFAASLLYGLRIIPYRPLEPLTAVLICGGGLAFAAGALITDRRYRRGRAVRAPQDRRAVELAAAAALVIAIALLTAFLVQASLRLGLKSVLLNEFELRATIRDGAFPVTIKYVYAALAAAGLCAIAAARASAGRRRLLWIVGCGIAIGSLYFSSGRANLALAIVAALVAGCLAGPFRLRVRHVLAASAAVAAATVALFFAIAELQDRGIESTELRFVPNRWQDTPISQLALPYEYVTAPIASLNELAAEAPAVGGANGCAALRVPCGALERLGAVTEPDPLIRAYTASPLRWNTYTSLDLPVIDGGWLLAVPIMLLTGLAMGLAWRYAGGGSTEGSTEGVLVYSIATLAIVQGPIQYGFLASHLIGAALIAVGLVAIARRLIVRADLERSAPGGVDSEERERSGRLWRTASRSELGPLAVAAGASAVVVLLLAVLGGRGPSADQRLAHRSIIDPKDLPSSLVSEAEIAAEPPGSARRAFLAYWRAVQQKSWPAALARFDPGLRALIGAERLVPALAVESVFYGNRAPRITGVDGHRKRADVQFVIADPAGSGTSSAHTVSFLRRQGRWRVIYDTILDSSLRASEQGRVQARIDPTKEPSAAARRGGSKAGSLQARYLDELDLAPPERPPGS